MATMTFTTDNLRAMIKATIVDALPDGFQVLETRRDDVFEVRLLDGILVGRIEFNVRSASVRMGDSVETRPTGAVVFDPYEYGSRSGSYKVTPQGEINVAGLVSRIESLAFAASRQAARRTAAKVQEAKDEALREVLQREAPAARVDVCEDVVSVRLANLSPAQARLILAAVKTALTIV